MIVIKKSENGKKSTMKAMVYERFGPPEVLHPAEVKMPMPKKDEVLIKVHATAVVKEEPDWRRSPGFNGFFKPKRKILGQELAGEIIEIGKEVTKFKTGDPVYGETGLDLGSHAEYKAMKQTAGITLKPDNLSFEEAAAIPNGALTALPFLRDKALIKSRQKVLVYGASGAVGTAAVQIAKYYGAEVHGVCSATNIEMVQSLGAAHVFDYTTEDFTESVNKYDIIYDTIGKCAYKKCKDSLTSQGIYITTVPSVGYMLKVLWQNIPGLRKAYKNRRKVKFLAAGLRSGHKKSSDLDFMKKMIESGKYKAVIDKTYKLENLPEAHKHVETKRKKGNVVITVSS